MRRLLLILLPFSLAACTGRLTPDTEPDAPGLPVAVATPSSGALNAAQLAIIASDIREVEANPLGRGADAARHSLLTWFIASPDVSGSLCTGVVGPFSDSESRYHGELLMQFILGLGAHQIEHPEDVGNAAVINLGAMESALHAYEVVLERDPRAKDDHMDRMLVRQRAGTLGEFIENATVDC